MRLLITTQAIDRADPILGFFCRWVEEFAQHCEAIEVICLREGGHDCGKSDFPTNVRVHSLGKERRAASRAAYAWRFLKLAWRLRRNYDAVFVHMNEEYVLLAGWLWKLLHKPVYLWRNHYAGSLRTDLAATFCKNVFCTSKYSYTAKYRKTVFMPVGIDTDRFKPDARIERKPHSILFLARMAPSKRPEILLNALALLARDGLVFSADFVGSPLPEHEAYYAQIQTQARTLALTGQVRFLPGIPNDQTPDLYRAHEVFVNCSPSGMFDKTLFEAAACGCFVLASSKDFATLAGSETYFDTAESLAAAMRSLLRSSANTASLERIVQNHSLHTLAVSLVQRIFHGVSK